MNYGRYQLIREVGRGAMGIVYQAHDPQIDRRVALKALRADRVTSEAFFKRFLKEAKAIGRLSHPGIVTVYDVGEDRETLYIAMEFLEGTPLDEVIKQKHWKLEEIVELGLQVAETLDYAHQKGVVHRDIKPSNIIVQPSGRIKITDFGIARIDDPGASLQTRDGEIIGTPAYMSPQQVLGKPVDGRSDLFSLGVILYELCTGRRPFGGEGKNLATVFNEIIHHTPRQPGDEVPQVPRELSAIIMKCLSKTPEDRFQTGKALADALQHCLRQPEPAPADAPMQPNGQDATVLLKREPPPVYAAPQPKEKSYTILLLMGLVILGLIGGFMSFRYPSRQPSENVTPRVETAPHPASIEKVAEPSSQLPVLRVETEPPGVELYVDGQLQGKTPMALELAPGTHQLRMALAGHRDWEQQVNLEQAKEYPLQVSLQALPKPPILTVETVPNGAELYVDGQLQGQTPMALELAPGTHRLRMALVGYRDWEEHLDLKQAEERPLRVELKAILKLAEVKLESMPDGAQIYVDRALKGKTPATLQLPPGRYRLRMALAGYQDWDKQVELKESTEHPIKITLKPVAPVALLRVVSTPAGAKIHVDGTPRGNTPSALKLSPGKHRVVVTLADYQDWEGEVQLEETREYPLNVVLKQAAKSGGWKEGPIRDIQ